MLIVDSIRVSVLEKEQETAVREEACRLLRIRPEEVEKLFIRRRSIDARKKPDVFYLYTVAVRVKKEHTILRQAKRGNRVRKDERTRYHLPENGAVFSQRPVVVGFGPAGMFAAYILALSGANPICLERGKTAEERRKDVERFFTTGIVNPTSNVQFGEGGAGTFSDGKLATQKNDRQGRNEFVLKTFHKFGADECILYDAKPHIGTDKLVEIVAAMRLEIIRLGGEVRFESRVESLVIEDGTVRGVLLSDGNIIETEHVLLGIGHSARDTFRKLHMQGVVMQSKPFAVGFRVEHPQELISRQQYGEKAAMVLPPAPYKLVANTGRPLYSFCMCPGGYVINASSEAGHLCVNGMSLSKRDSANANSALVMPVALDDEYPLLGLHFQEELERAAYDLAGGKIPQQLLGDFVENRPSRSYGRFSSCVKGESALCNLRGLLGQEAEEHWLSGLREMDKKLHGFWDEEMILSGIESRTSSPVRIPRNDRFEASVRGLYPCGEGAGYAGGITSAAMDGMKAAEAVLAAVE